MNDVSIKPGDRVYIDWLNLFGTITSSAGTHGSGKYAHQRFWIVELDDGKGCAKLSEEGFIPVITADCAKAPHLRLVVDNTIQDTMPSEMTP